MSYCMLSLICCKTSAFVIPVAFSNNNALSTTRQLDEATKLSAAAEFTTTWLTSMDLTTAEAIAGPFFAASLFPYLAFLYFLNRHENQTPKGVTIGFATCLLFVVLTIPAAIAAKIQFGVSLADSDWLHGSAESLLTVTNLVTVIAFRQAFRAHQQELPPPVSATSYAPMAWLVVTLTVLAGMTAVLPAATGATVHTPYLNGFLDLPSHVMETFDAHPEPENALTIACWMIHISSLVEFLVVMDSCWKWSSVTNNPRWKGLSWGLLPLHSSGITACTYHLFYNHIPFLVPFQALLTCVGNTTAAYAAFRIAVSNGYTTDLPFLSFLVARTKQKIMIKDSKDAVESDASLTDRGQALAADDNDYSFLFKLIVGCALGSYAIKYGETFFDFPFVADLGLSVTIITIPSLLNSYRWDKRSKDPNVEGCS